MLFRSRASCRWLGGLPLVASRRAAVGAMVRRHGGVSGGEFSGGMGGPDGHPSPVQGCTDPDASAPPPLSSAVCSLLGFWRCSRQGGCWHLHRRGLPVRPKPRPLGVHGVAWMLGGGPGGGRRGVRGQSARLGCGRAAMATWVAWLVMFGEAWWFGRGLTSERITCPVFSGRRWRRPRASFPS